MVKIEQQKTLVYFGILAGVLLFWGLVIYSLAGCAARINSATTIQWGDQGLGENTDVRIEQKENQNRKDVI